MTIEPDDRQATAGASARVLNDPSAGAGATGQLTRGFLFADLRGYTAFVEARGDSAAADLLDVYRRLVRDVVRRFGGAEIKTEGDSFYVVVPSASDAVRCGIAIVAAARQASIGQPDRPIQVGIGVHAGESTTTAEGFVGSAVNIAARVCAQAAAGEVLVTDTVRSLTRTSGGIAFAERRRKRLKGIAEPVTVYAASSTDGQPTGVATTRLPWARGKALGASAAIATVALLAIAGAFLARSTGLPAASPGQSGLAAGPGTSPARASPTAAPSSTTFPTTAELKLIAALPPALRTACVRGGNQADLVAAGFAGQVTGSVSGAGSSKTSNKFDVLPPPAEASLGCVPGGGPNGAWFLWYGVGTDSPAEIAVADMGTHMKAPGGDCSAPPALGSWRTKLGASGSVLCLRDTGPAGQPWIYWSFGSAHVLGVATAPVGHYQALYDWWQTLTPFLK